MSIVVFDPMATEFDGNGAAVLTPIRGTVRQVAGGEYSFSLEHPMDPNGKWKHLKREAIVRLPVPAEVIENSYTGIEADIYKTTSSADLREGTTEPTTISYNAWSQYSTYSVGSKVTSQSRNYECIYWDSNSTYRAERPGANPEWWKEIARRTNGSPVLVTLPAGSILYLVEDYSSTWYKVQTPYGVTGFIKKSQVTFDHHASASEIQPRVITEQLFRIKDVNRNRDAGTVSVSGVHVSYDLNGNLVDNLVIGQAGAAMAINRVYEGLELSYPGVIATNITDSGDTTFTGTFTRKNGMHCMADPDSGIVGTFGATLRRDNWDMFVMASADVDRGYRIRYGKNADGIQWRQRTDGLVTRVMPVAKSAAGGDLYLPEKYVDSSYISAYPVIYMEALQVKGQVGKDDGSNTDTVWTENALLDEMRAKAGERFSVDKADVPVTEITVQLAQLENTAEYAWLKDLLRVTLYDTVRAQDLETGMDEALKVTEIEYDVVRGRVAGVKLASTEGVQRTVTGYNVANASIGIEKLKDETIREIQGGAVDASVSGAESRMPVVQANTATADGIVTKGSGQANKVWKTDNDGNPAWRDDDSGGDVSGPSSATDGNVALFDGATGKLIKDSGKPHPVSSIGTADNPVTDLANIPVNSIGNTVLAAAVSPSGLLRAHSYWKTGSSATRYTIFAVDQYAKRAYYQVNYDGTLSGWIALPDGVIDNLTSTSSTAALSAAQGKALNDDLAGRARKIVLTTDDDTWANVWAKIDVLGLRETATFYCAGTPYSLLSGGARSMLLYGTITRTGSSDQFEIIMKSNGNRLIGAQITGASSSSAGTYEEIDYSNHTLGTTVNPITDMADIPLGSTGNVVLAAAISPTGNVASLAYWKHGNDDARWSIFAIRETDNTAYLNSYVNGTYSGWKKLVTDKISTFRGVSSNGEVTFTIPTGSHASVMIGVYNIVMYMSSANALSAGTMPSGFTVRNSGTSVTITRGNDTAYVCSVIIVPM